MAMRDDLKREWFELSRAWIKEVREGRNSTRNGLLDLPMIEACGSVEGLKTEFHYLHLEEVLRWTARNTQRAPANKAMQRTAFADC